MSDNKTAFQKAYKQNCKTITEERRFTTPEPKPDTVTISRECAERSHVRASYYLQAAYNKAVGPEALKDFNELTKALEVTG